MRGKGWQGKCRAYTEEDEGVDVEGQRIRPQERRLRRRRRRSYVRYVRWSREGEGPRCCGKDKGRMNSKEGEESEAYVSLCLCVCGWV